MYLFVEITVKPGKRGEFLAKLEKHAAGVRVENGCENLQLFADTQNENRVCVWEIWRDRYSWDLHMENDQSTRWRQVAAEFVLGEEISVLTSL